MPRTILEPAEWRTHLDDHASRLRPYVERWKARRARGEKHPVEDFLFTYYSFSASKLMQWHPGFGSALRIDGEPLPRWFAKRGYHHEGDLVQLDANALGEGALRQIQFIAKLLAATASRPPHLGCHGLHEWAMVYRLQPDEIRHEQWPLRLPPEQITDLVDSRPLTCTHYDAFRFFTPGVASRNASQPSYETRVENEQPGCIHAGMDLYKWAYKLTPWIPGHHLADAFLLAAEAREIDMRASPYDLRDLGFDSIPVETEQGREQYREAQLAMAEKAAPLRAALLEGCRAVLDARISPAT